MYQLDYKAYGEHSKWKKPRGGEMVKKAKIRMKPAK